jgi:hypothetical protein
MKEPRNQDLKATSLELVPEIHYATKTNGQVPQRLIKMQLKNEQGLSII